MKKKLFEENELADTISLGVCIFVIIVGTGWLLGYW